jgi:phenylacetate-coenzyme A ligase PaaK-like adenylate-forming protein
VPIGLAAPLRAGDGRLPRADPPVGPARRLPPRLAPTLRLDATSALDESVAALNTFQPRLLVAYASVLRALAAEQRAGRLRIAAASVMSASEVLAEQGPAEVSSAWGSAPFDVYASTETGGIASPRVFHNVHLYEDLVIVEPVDEAGVAVEPGVVGARALVAALFSRTLPLIRHEMSDRVSVGGRGRPCGRSFALLTGIEGRAQDVLALPGLAGQVSIHPNVFHNVPDEVTLAGWQVIQESCGLRVLLVGLAPQASVETVQSGVVLALTSAGVVGAGVTAQLVEALERTPLGKAPLVRALKERP